MGISREESGSLKREDSGSFEGRKGEGRKWEFREKEREDSGSLKGQGVKRHKL